MDETNEYEKCLENQAILWWSQCRYELEGDLEMREESRWTAACLLYREGDKFSRLMVSDESAIKALVQLFTLFRKCRDDYRLPPYCEKRVPEEAAARQRRVEALKGKYPHLSSHLPDDENDIDESEEDK